MKVGEITFYYATGRTITEYYFSESERSKYIATYKYCRYYTVIPYAGSGVANYLDTLNKCYRATFPEGKGPVSRWKLRHEVIEKNKAA
jgi:hypothetical protein